MCHETSDNFLICPTDRMPHKVWLAIGAKDREPFVWTAKK
jgi:hypothetical protein